MTEKNPPKTPPAAQKLTSTKLLGPKSPTSQQPIDTINPNPLQINTGYFDEKGDFIPPGVLKAPFSGKLFNISQKSGLDNFLKHLIEDYKLVVADLVKIADFTLYMRYWTERFDMERNVNNSSPSEVLGKYCTPIQTNPLDPKKLAGREDKKTEEEQKALKQVTYYLLSDALDEDKTLRQNLQLDRLRYVLAIQEQERADASFTGKCFFCKYRVTKGNPRDLLLHMTKCHKFEVGHPDNIVLIREFIEKIKAYFDENICAYCNKKFKDKNTLLEHMKKKKHRSLDPKNKSFDRYYVINYLEPGKNWADYRDEIKMQEQIEIQLRRDAKLRGRFMEETIGDNNVAIERKRSPSEKLNINAATFIPGKVTPREGTPSAEHGNDKKDLFELTPESEKKKEEKAIKDTQKDDESSDEGWEEQPDYSDQIFKCLFSNNYFHTADQCLDSMKANYNFDLESFATKHSLNFYQTVKLINFIRQKVLEGDNYEKLQEKISDVKNFDEIKYMFSTFEDDQLLYTFQSRYSQQLFDGEKQEDEEEEKEGTKIDSDEDKIDSGMSNITIVDGVKIISEDVEDIASIKARSVLKDLVTDKQDTVFE